MLKHLGCEFRLYGSGCGEERGTLIQSLGEFNKGSVYKDEAGV